MDKTFVFDIEDLKQIADEHPEVEEDENSNIRLCGAYSHDDGKTWDFDEVKCNGCNWEVTRLYVRAESREEAVRLLISSDESAGLCGECYAQMMAEEDSS
jgi:hypothetical protein